MATAQKHMKRSKRSSRIGIPTEMFARKAFEYEQKRAKFKAMKKAEAIDALNESVMV